MFARRCAGLESDADRIEQIMIVGGTMRDLDRGFLHHVALAKSASEEIARRGEPSAISVHISTMPPRNLDLIEHLADIPNVHVMFNLEVWDAALFAAMCPGKTRDYGRNTFLLALGRLRDVVGAYRATRYLLRDLNQQSQRLRVLRHWRAWAFRRLSISTIPIGTLA